MKHYNENCLLGEHDVDEDVDMSEEQCGSTGSHLTIRDFDCLSATTSESSVGIFSSSAAPKRISDNKISSVASKSFQSSSKTTTMDGFVARTSKYQQDTIDEKIARFIYATNSPFRIVNNKHFIDMVESLRPGYTPPGRADIGGRSLDTVYEKELEQCARNTEGKFASLSLYWWSNVHNDPVICACVTTEDGVAHLSETIDTSGNVHTAEYLKQVAVKAVINCEQKFNCHMHSFVTDNAANVAKMRRYLKEEREGCSLITYGCSAHLMHLLAKDVSTSPGIKENRDCCCIADAVKVWKALQETLKKEIPNQKVKLQAIKK
ncbi:PREDICTED: uncharacterized protein LOC109302279 [Gavialis gangeticus]|uniref:uncharacterized protein LOC109302279 n=1 Tax=Gavialis gangeticus TaxID=94835 RepID=UPI00092F8E9A|nr:PREDICTED: uncharacterized protein LOC109302279 [Gavialis gangeticus]